MTTPEQFNGLTELYIFFSGFYCQTDFLLLLLLWGGGGGGANHVETGYNSYNRHNVIVKWMAMFQTQNINTMMVDLTGSIVLQCFEKTGILHHADLLLCTTSCDHSD